MELNRNVLIEEIAQTAKSMREAQKAYFRSRSKEALTRSKSLERALDGHLAKLEMFDNPMGVSMFEEDRP